MSESDEVETSQPASTKRRGRPSGALLRVACPTCLASVGVQCRSGASGKIIASGHAARRALAGLSSGERAPSKRERLLQAAIAAFKSPVVTLVEKDEGGARDLVLTVQSVRLLKNGSVVLVGARPVGTP